MFPLIFCLLLQGTEDLCRYFNRLLMDKDDGGGNWLSSHRIRLGGAAQ